MIGSDRNAWNSTKAIYIAAGLYGLTSCLRCILILRQSLSPAPGGQAGGQMRPDVSSRKQTHSASRHERHSASRHECVELIHGNGYLAVYIAGLVVGNHKIVYKRILTTFFDGFINKKAGASFDTPA